MEREICSQLNAEFQRRARRDKKGFLSECKEVEENSRMGKTRDLEPAKTRLGADFGSDHEPLIAKFRLKESREDH